MCITYFNPLIQSSVKTYVNNVLIQPGRSLSLVETDCIGLGPYATNWEIENEECYMYWLRKKDSEVLKSIYVEESDLEDDNNNLSSLNVNKLNDQKVMNSRNHVAKDVLFTPKLPNVACKPCLVRINKLSLKFIKEFIRSAERIEKNDVDKFEQQNETDLKMKTALQDLCNTNKKDFYIETKKNTKQNRSFKENCEQYFKVEGCQFSRKRAHDESLNRISREVDNKTSSGTKSCLMNMPKLYPLHAKVVSNSIGSQIPSISNQQEISASFNSQLRTTNFLKQIPSLTPKARRNSICVELKKKESAAKCQKLRRKSTCERTINMNKIALKIRRVSNCEPKTVSKSEFKQIRREKLKAIADKQKAVRIDGEELARKNGIVQVIKLTANNKCAFLSIIPPASSNVVTVNGNSMQVNSKNN